MIIDRVFIAVLLLSISGLVFCVIFLPFEDYASQHTSAKTMVVANTVTLFSFVLPFYFLDAIFIDRSEEIFQHYNTLVFEGETMYQDAAAIVREVTFIKYASRIWLVGVIVYLLYQLSDYIRLRKRIKAGWFDLDDDAWGACFERMKAEKNISNVRLIGCKGIGAPCTAGVWKKYVIIPTGLILALDDEEIEFILAHEFCHMVHNDPFWRLLILLLGAANWFNPLFRYLNENLSGWQEIACDDEVTKGFSKEKISKYCHLVVKVLEQAPQEEPTPRKRFRIGFDGNSYKYQQRRLDKIMHKNGLKGIWGKAVVASVTVVSMASGNVVAKAADLPVNQMFAPNARVVEAGELEVIEGTEIPFEDGFEATGITLAKDFVEVDLQDTADTAYEIIYNGPDAVPTGVQAEIEPRHSHKIVDVTLKEHKKLSDGSCKTTYYEGKKCTSCGATWQGSKINTITQEICTH